MFGAGGTPEGIRIKTSCAKRYMLEHGMHISCANETNAANKRSESRLVLFAGSKDHSSSKLTHTLSESDHWDGFPHMKEGSERLGSEANVTRIG